MASISSVINASSIYAYEAQQNTPKQKPVQTQNPTDVVQLSHAALAALGGGGDTDHDGDSR